MEFNLTKMLEQLSSPNAPVGFSENLANDPDLTNLMQAKIDSQRFCLGLYPGQKFPYASYTGEKNDAVGAAGAAVNAANGIVGNAGSQVNASKSGIQHVIDKYGNGRAPVNADDFITVSSQTGVPIDLMLAQAIQESTIGTAGRAARTHNIYNVGNDDAGNNRELNAWRAGMLTYANLIKSIYAPDPNNITAESVINPQYVVRRGHLKGARYAKDGEYENELTKILAAIRPILGQADPNIEAGMIPPVHPSFNGGHPTANSGDLFGPIGGK